MSESRRLSPTCTHWGNYLIESDGESILAVHPYKVDGEPTPIGQSLLNALDEGARVPRPMVRAGYLEHGRNSDGSGRGVEPFVPVSWDRALDVAADALRHTMDNNGPSSIYGGSYGWSSAGRFHHAQSQIHRFLGQLGGYVDSVNSYSTAAAEVIINHVLGIPFLKLVREAPPCGEIAQHAQTLVLFGGAAIKNTQVNAGGIGTHCAREQLIELKAAGVEIVNISPVRNDVISELDARWLACRPGSDVAIMLGLAHTLASENYTTGNLSTPILLALIVSCPTCWVKQTANPKMPTGPRSSLRSPLIRFANWRARWRQRAAPSASAGHYSARNSASRPTG